MTPPLVHYRQIAAGDAGALDTLVVMRGLVNDATRNPWAVGTARRLVDAGEHDDPEQVIENIRAVCEDYFRFAYDPAPRDRVASPVLLLQEWAAKGTIRGDCDDAAVLVAFLGTVHYLPWKFRAVGFTGAGPLSHVYTLLRGSREWHSLDVTKNGKQVMPAARRYLDYP